MSSDHRAADHPLTPGQHSHARVRESVEHSRADREDDRGDGQGHRAGGSGHDFDLPALPEAVDIFDTTLRDGSQQEGLSLTVDDKLRVAEQLDHLGVTFIEGGWPGANPKDAEFFAAGPDGAHARHGRRWWRSARPGGPGSKPEDDETLRHLVAAQTEAVCIVAKSSEMHVADALRTSLDEAVAMVADSVAVPARERPAGLPRRRALLRRLQGQPRIHPTDPPGSRGGGRGDTGPLRHQRRHPALRGGAHRRRGVRPVRDPGGCALPQRRRLRGGQLARRGGESAPPTSRAASTATASGPATPTSRPPSPTSRSSSRSRTIPADRLELTHPGLPPHRRAGQHRPEPPAALRRLVGVRPQGRAAHHRHRAALRRLRARRARRWSATAPASSSRRWPAVRPWP